MSIKSIKKDYEKQGINLDDNQSLLNEISILQSTISLNETMTSSILPYEINMCSTSIKDGVNTLYEYGVYDKKTKWLLSISLLSEYYFIAKIGIDVLKIKTAEYSPYSLDDKEVVLKISKDILMSIKKLNEAKIKKIKTFVDSGKAEVKLEELKKYKKRN